MDHDTPFTPPKVTLAPGVAREALPLWDFAGRMLLALMAAFGAPARAALSNDPPERLREALIRAGRLVRIVRRLLVVFGARLLKDNPGLGARRAKCASDQTRARENARRPAQPHDPASWRIPPLLASPLRLCTREPTQAQPAHLASAARNPARLLARRMEALWRMLTRGDALARSAARLIARAIFVRRAARRSRACGPFAQELDLAADLAGWAIDPANTS